MLFGPPNLKVRCQNFFRENLTKTSLAAYYLYPGAMEKLSRKLVHELEPGARVTPNTFAIPSWTPRLVRNQETSCGRRFFTMRCATSISPFSNI